MNAPVTGVNLADLQQADGTLEIPLVDGSQCAEHSRDSVMQMINDLQTYHRRRNFSHQERFGRPDPLSEQALEGLDRALESASRLIEDAEDSSVALTIESTIKVTVAPQA